MQSPIISLTLLIILLLTRDTTCSSSCGHHSETFERGISEENEFHVAENDHSKDTHAATTRAQRLERLMKICAKQNGFRSELKFIPGGDFMKGASKEEAQRVWHVGLDFEVPQQQATVAPFLLDDTTTSYCEFLEFVNYTGYVTEAETIGDSFVFQGIMHPHQITKTEHVLQGADWWTVVPTASWLFPTGADQGQDEFPFSDPLDVFHPVLHVSWNDANAFCKFLGKRLPTEAEWEFAARGGKEQMLFPWGNRIPNENDPEEKWPCNIWQGVFPTNNLQQDRYYATAPSRSFEPNSYGLYNMVGNVWEWVSDSWSATNPSEKVQKGGSYLCHPSYCFRFRNSARTKGTADSSTSSLSFRCAMDYSDGTGTPQMFRVAPLPYLKSALEPYISKETVEFHYEKHHKGYATKLNALYYSKGLKIPNLEEIIGNRDAIGFNLAAQIWNHDFYWKSLAPNGGGDPTGMIAEKILQQFDSFAEFQRQFSENANSHFGSGWVWLIQDKSTKKISIVQGHDAENPLALSKKEVEAGKEAPIPILVLDVWEHAFYIDYRNNKKQYIDNFWNLVNWDFANENLLK